MFSLKIMPSHVIYIKLCYKHCMGQEIRKKSSSNIVLWSITFAELCLRPGVNFINIFWVAFYTKVLGAPFLYLKLCLYCFAKGATVDEKAACKIIGEIDYYIPLQQNLSTEFLHFASFSKIKIRRAKLTFLYESSIHKVTN